MKKSVLLLFALFLCGAVNAKKPYDPSLDSACVRLPKTPVEQWSGQYLWYPGQLSAHKQQQLQTLSRERCTYVGYPGKFFAPLDRASFRKTVKTTAPRQLRWSAPGSVSVRIDGRQLENGLREWTLPAGRHSLYFEVTSPGRLPCLILEGAGVSDPAGWQVSLDGTAWRTPEHDPRYDSPQRRPDDPQEERYAIRPERTILFDNVTRRGDTLRFAPGGCAILDFRHDELGIVRLTAQGKGTLTFNPGESPEEALNRREVDYEQRPLATVTLGDTPREIVLPERALRFLRIESSGPSTVSSVVFEAGLWPVEHAMQFECSDPLLNRIWEMGAATVHTGMHDFYLDGIKRDGLPWAMDVVQTALAGDYLFGDRQVSRNGISMALMPLDPQSTDLGIVDFPLYALIGIKHDYLRYGDFSTAELFKDRMMQLLDFYASRLDEKGFLSGHPSQDGFLPSWATMLGPEKGGQAAYGQMILALNFEIGAYFATLWGERKLAQKYEATSLKIRENILRYFWDDERGAFINGLLADGTPDRRISHHAQFWGILTGLFPPERYDHYFDTILPAMEYHHQTYSIEKGYEFLAYVKAGRTADLMRILTDVWGGWVQQGFSRFPENIFPDYSRTEQLAFYDRPYGLSLCHPCNGVPPLLAVLHGVMGFSQSDSAPAEYTLAPQLGELGWFRGRIPVKEGFIELKVSRENGMELSVPAGCTVHVADAQSARRLLSAARPGRYTVKF